MARTVDRRFVNTRSSEHSKLKPIPIKSKVIAGIGGISEMLSSQAPRQLALPVYNLSLGLSASLVGISQGSARLCEALLSPFIGNLSDRVKTRWGRRRPFMLFGSILSSVFFAAMWFFPRGQSLAFYFCYLTVSSALFYTASSLFVVPWEALLTELSDDYNERTSVQGFRSILTVGGALLMPWLFAATQLPVFTDTIAGVRAIGVFVGAILLLAGIIPALFLREPAAIHPPAPSVSIVTAVRQTLRQRQFALMVGATLLYGPGVMLTEEFSLYVNIYHVFHGNLRAAALLEGYQGTLLYTGKIVWVPVLMLLAPRFGKRPLLLVCLSLSLLSDLMRWFCYTPDNPYLQLAPTLLQSVGMAPSWVLMSSMIADAIDHDERLTGTRRSGLYLSVALWIRKMGLTASVAFSGLILASTGFLAALGPQQTPETVREIRMAFTIVPALATLGAMTCILLYLDIPASAPLLAATQSQPVRADRNQPP